MTNPCPDGPFTVEVQILFLDADQNEARVTYTLPRGVYPTKAAVQNAIAETAKAVPAGFNLADRHQFIKVELGLQNVAIPGPREFAVEAQK